MMQERIFARYWIETAFPLSDAAQARAGEQSTGTFTRVPGETSELRARHGAVVEQVEELDGVDEPSLPGARAPSHSGPVRYRRAHVTLWWPLSNMGPSLPNVLATVAGNLFELNQFSGLRLLDVRFPPPFLDRYSGPRFGVEGTRRLSGVWGRPLIGTIVKPSVGLTPESTGAVVGDLAAGGIDFIKDDELQADGPHCPFAERLAAVMRVVDREADRGGKRIMYAFNITGELDEMLRRQEAVAKAGGTCVMVSINSVGLPGLSALRRDCPLPIHAHRNGWGIYSRSPAIGMSYVAYQKFWRLAGVDHMHVNGIRNKFCEDDASVIASPLRLRCWPLRRHVGPAAAGHGGYRRVRAIADYWPRVAHQQLGTILVGVAAGFLNFGLGSWWATVNDASPMNSGVISSIMNTGANVAGIASPVLTPYIAERLGWIHSLDFAALVIFASGAEWLFIRQPRGKGGTQE